MSSPEAFDAGVAHQIGHYADAVRVPSGYDQILVSRHPGARSRWLPGHRHDRAGHPGLVRPDLLVEAEVIAAVPARQAP